MTPDGNAHAIVLSGGGGYGAYEIGVMRALFSGEASTARAAAVDPVVVSGTSAGAFNAALMCSAPPGMDSLGCLDHVEDVWLEAIAGDDCGSNVLRFRANPLVFLQPDCLARERTGQELTKDVGYITDQLAQRAARFITSDEGVEQRVLDAIDASLIVSGDRFGQVVRETVDLANIRQSPRALRITATNWRTGIARVFANADMSDRLGHRIVMASTAIPGVFQTVELEGEPYADGGLVMNTPLRPAIEAGANVLHVVYMDPNASRIPLPRLRNTASTMYRFAVIALGSMMSRDIEIAKRVNLGLDVMEGRARVGSSVAHTAGVQFLLARLAEDHPITFRRLVIHRYHPSDDPGGTFRWLTFDRDRMVRMMERGYEDALAHDCEQRDCLVG
jgi:NTE family protein